MKVEIGAEAALFPGKEYINGIFLAVQGMSALLVCLTAPFFSTLCKCDSRPCARHVCADFILYIVNIYQWWANIYLHTFDSDLRFLLYRSPTLFTLFFKGRIEGQRLLPSIFCKVGVDGSMFFNLDSVKVDSYPS
jgi:hypothetical protein